MKNIFIFFFLIASCVTYAQNYSVWFTYPTNGSTVCNVYSSSQAAISTTIGATGTPDINHFKWKFVLNTDNGSNTIYDSDTFPAIYRGSGTYYWNVDMIEVLTNSQEIARANCQLSFNVKYIISAVNNFGNGTINLEGSTVQSGSATGKFVSESVSVGAIDQNDGNGYDRIWNTDVTNNSYWYRDDSQISGATSRNYSYTVKSYDNGITLIADLKKICDLEFQNSYAGIYVGGNLYSSPKTADVIEQNSVYAEGQDYEADNLIHRFYRWTSGSNTYSSEITASAHQTFTAEYKAYPSNNGKNPSFNGSTGDPINITWTDNPNDDVTQYQIWRKVKHNGVLGSATLLATLDKGVETYTDYEYKFTNGYTDDMLYYDVREYYEPDNTYSDPEWNMVYGEYNNENKVKNDNAFAKLKEAIPENYSISNYPNPFNPTTTINYQLPENGFVTLKVYDILGKEIASLVNENKTAGYYNVNFDAGRLTSGVYIYAISVNNFIQSKKMLLVK